MMTVFLKLTFLPLEQINEMDTWADAKLNEAKEILAFELTRMVHGEEEAAKAQEAARALFGGDAEALMDGPFTVVTPDSKNPYRQMYAAN